ncbi:MAG: glycosyltransferase, partial [Vicinamibacterales bacterium]
GSVSKRLRLDEGVVIRADAVPEPKPAVKFPSGRRPRVLGKFVYVGSEKLFIRGVTYGTFRPRNGGDEFPEPEVVECDFSLMSANGINAIRTYTPPPQWLLDAARRHGLWVMVGLPVERHIGLLADDRRKAANVANLVRRAVEGCGGHPAILCYAVGNEIPASVARWHNHTRVARFLDRLYRAAKAADPGGLVTYVNYPSTEYLNLPALDLVCFNVFLESESRFAAYISRLQNLARNRPLVLTEIGLDTLRNGEAAQARALGRQLRAAFQAGGAGAFVYSWTDEWYRSGADVEDWAFGLTRRDRQPKRALAAVRSAFADVPFRQTIRWPRVSVVVCTYNGARTLRECLQGIQRLDYPNYEVIVVNDGSTDATPVIAREFPCQLISTPNRGLSNARNTGLAAATGEIVAYIDDDAYPDPHWLTYLASTFLTTDYAGIGGPNISPPDDGPIAECVTNSPGNPIHVLLSDQEAEHIPGCNMAFRKASLEAIGGFDPQFRVAGDDVDVCWQLQQAGWRLGFSPAAVVLHHRRNSVRAFWKQQRGYGWAEALLEKKWPEKYTSTGQITWNGRLYGLGLVRSFRWSSSRIYHGVWGTAPFQSIYEPAPTFLSSLPHTPEWYLLVAILTVLSELGLSWRPLGLALVPLAAALALAVAHAGAGASQAHFPKAPNGFKRLKRRALTAALYLIQPVARLSGRTRSGLTPWRRHGSAEFTRLWTQTSAIWSEHWQDAGDRLAAVEATLKKAGECVRRGGNFDRWDLEVRGGAFGAARLLMAVEEHGLGKQLVRIRTWPSCPARVLVLVLVSAALSLGAARDQAVIAATVLGIPALLCSLRALRDCAAATAAFRRQRYTPASES